MGQISIARTRYHQEVVGYGDSDDLAPTTNYELVDVYIVIQNAKQFRLSTFTFCTRVP